MLKVEIFEHTPNSSQSGIGRYTNQIYQHLSSRIPVEIKYGIDPPFPANYGPRLILAPEGY